MSNLMTATQAYNLVALKGASLEERLNRGMNGNLSLYGEEEGRKYILKETRAGENTKLLQQELVLLRYLNEEGAQVPSLHPDYEDDSWGKPEDIAMLLLNNAATIGDYCEAYLASQIPIEILKEVIQAAKIAVESVHEAGVLHNDLHGNNIVITLERGKFKGYVIDFGWSYLESKGIPQWMKRERTWYAEEPEDDIEYLLNDLRGRGDDGDYLEVIELLDR